MSTDSPIPERWRDVAELSQRSPNHRNWHDDLNHCAIELGTAESLVRDLAQYAQHKPACRVIAWGDGVCTCGFDVAQSRIPAHLRAPETTSTGESSTVLRQEGKP